MKTSGLAVGLLSGIASLVLSGTVMAEGFPKNYGYWTDASGSVVRNWSGECWHTINWSAAVAIAECEPGLVKKVVEVPKPAPAPVVAAAPAPAPAPAPVVAP